MQNSECRKAARAVALSVLNSEFGILNSAFSEIKLIDIVLGEHERLAEQDVVALDLDLAEPAGLKRRVARPSACPSSTALAA